MVHPFLIDKKGAPHTKLHDTALNRAVLNLTRFHSTLSIVVSRLPIKEDGNSLLYRTLPYSTQSYFTIPNSTILFISILRRQYHDQVSGILP